LEADVKSLAFKEDINAKKQQSGTEPNTTPPVITNISNRKPTLPKLDLSGFLKNRPVSPILDLHADYDENSLPSPTRDNTAPLPVPKPVGFVPGTIPLPQPVFRNNPGSIISAEGYGTKVQPYITDAFKAVSTYQQRYGKSTVFVTDDLPSPTPSDEEKCKKDVEGATGEVSSVPVSATSGSLAASLPVPHSAPVMQAGVRSAPKSRDPRLRLINPETRGSSTELNPNSDFRKKKAPEESLADESAVKRQRNGSGKGGWLEEANDRPIQPNSITNFNQQSTGSCPTVSIPTILKDMVVNPTMLVKLLQQKLASESQLKTITNNPPPRSTPVPVPVPAPALPPPPPPPPVIPTNVPSTKPAEPVPYSNISAARVVQPLAQPAAPVRMKPRDPRRVLHNGTGSLATELVRPNSPPSADIATFREQVEPAGNITSGLRAGPDMTPSESGSPWGNVEYLLDGYNDKQKAAIQRERGRRIAEQNKMFAAKKLCLVLDLDHTLLNSAKVYIFGSLSLSLLPSLLIILVVHNIN
jgi:RNA polymerase II C-terminal domain phosphatase-like 3/4